MLTHFVVRALAASGQLSVHTVKGAELMDKWVGSSEKAVRDLFARARESAPSLIFLDEVDALAPRRERLDPRAFGKGAAAKRLQHAEMNENIADRFIIGDQETEAARRVEPFQHTSDGHRLHDGCRLMLTAVAIPTIGVSRCFAARIAHDPPSVQPRQMAGCTAQFHG